MRTYLNDNWEYFDNWQDDILLGSGQGKSVRLPHANIELPFNCFDEKLYQFVSGYRKHFALTELDGKTVLVTFEAVGHYAEVYVNGKFVGNHADGYTAFTFDITNFVTVGDNVIVVKCDSRENLNQPPFGYVIDYLTYGGIYREAYLDVHEGTYPSDVFVVALPNEPTKVAVELSNFVDGTEVRFVVKDGDDKVVHCNKIVATCAKIDYSFTIDNPVLWDIDNPYLYRLEVSVAGESLALTFGIRSAEFTADGFLLNGNPVKIVGLNRHQSFPYVGYAMPESMQRRDADILKNRLHVNAVRTSHYPQSKYFIDECDKQGLLVFTEIPGWQHIGNEEWQTQALENVREMVMQYRNHPSIVLWGVRINESQDNDELYKQTNALAHSLDGSRQTGGVRYLTNSHLFEDVYTFNDFNRNGAADRKRICKSGVPYLVTEFNGHMYPTKTFDDAPHRRAHMLRYAKMLNDVFGADGTCGCFGWCMFDYNTHKDFGSGDRICYHGVTDMFRNLKDAARVYQSFGGKPFVYPCFSGDIGDYPEGIVGDMYVLTNCDSVKVYRGDKYVKEYTADDSPFGNLPHPPILLNDMIGDRLINEDGFSVKNSERAKKCFAAVTKYGLSNLPLSVKLTMARVMLSQKLKFADVVRLYGKYFQGWGGEANAIRLDGYANGQLADSVTVGIADGYELSVEVSRTTLVEDTTYDVAAVNFAALDKFGRVCTYVNKVVGLRAEGAVELVGPQAVALQGGMFGCFVRSVCVGKGKLWVDDRVIEFEVVKK